MSDMTVDYIDQNRDRLVAELRRRQAVIRDFARGVARQYSTGLYLFGAREPPRPIPCVPCWNMKSGRSTPTSAAT